MQAFDCNRRERSHRIEQRAPLGIAKAFRMIGVHQQYTARPQRRHQRQRQRRSKAALLGGQEHRLSLLIDRPYVRLSPIAFVPDRNRAQFIMGVGQIEDRLDLQPLPEKALQDIGHLVCRDRAGQILRHVVERARLLLAPGRKHGLVAQTRGKLADDQRHDQHHGKGDQVLHVGHGHGKSRRHEEVIEQGHAAEGRQDRRPAAEPDRHQGNHQQEEHDDVGCINHAEQRQGQQGCGDAGQCGLQIGSDTRRLSGWRHEIMLPAEL